MGPAWLLAVQLFLDFVPKLPSLIQAAETAFGHKPSSGEQKKAFVMEAAKTSLDLAADAGLTHARDTEMRDAVLGAVDHATEATLAALKAADALKKPKLVEVHIDATGAKPIVVDKDKLEAHVADAVEAHLAQA